MRKHVNCGKMYVGQYSFSKMWVRRKSQGGVTRTVSKECTKQLNFGKGKMNVSLSKGGDRGPHRLCRVRARSELHSPPPSGCWIATLRPIPGLQWCDVFQRVVVHPGCYPWEVWLTLTWAQSCSLGCYAWFLSGCGFFLLIALCCLPVCSVAEFSPATVFCKQPAGTDS